MRKLFLWIFRDFMGIFKTLKTKFFWPRTAAARLGRSTVAVDRRARKRARRLPLSRSTARSTDWEQPTLGLLPVDRAVDRPRYREQRSLSGRPLSRPGANREQPALSRSTVRSTGSWGSQRARIRARRSTLRSTGYMVQSTVRSTDLAWQLQFWARKTRYL